MTAPPVGTAPAAARERPERSGIEAPRSTPRAPAPVLQRPVVIVADDDADMRAYMHHALRGQAVVHEAADGAEALRLARLHQPRLVVADVRMPGLDGRSLCTALGAEPATSGILVLLVSGEPRGREACAAGFLAKPFNAAGLREAVARLLPR